MTVGEPTRTAGPAQLPGAAPPDEPADRPEHRTWGPTRKPGAIARSCAWVAFPIAGMVWVATRYDRNWYVADEWMMFDRMNSSNSWLTSAFEGTFGHLMVPTHAVYSLQKALWGVEQHQFVWFVFCLSLAALQLSIAAVLRRLGLPTVIALLGASVVTFFGAGAHDMTWQFQLGVNFALSLCFVAAFLALRNDATTPAAIAIAALLVAATATDSGIAAFGAVYVGVLLLFLWPRRLGVVALVPPFLAQTAWLIFGEGATYRRLPFGTMASFAWHLLTLSAGGLVGGGETKRAVGIAIGGSPGPSRTIPISGEAVGVMALLAASVCVAIALARGRLPRDAAASLVGGLAAAVLAVVLLARTRAFIPPIMLPSGGARFIQWIAIFLLLAFAPAIRAALLPRSPQWRFWGANAAAIGLIVVFVLNLQQLRPLREFHEAVGKNLKSEVRQTITLLNEGCGGGRRPDPRVAFKHDSLGLFTVGQLDRFLAQGDLTNDFGIAPTREVRAAVCTREVPRS